MLKKFLGALLLPLSAILLLQLAAALLWWRRRPRAAVLCAVLASSILLTASNEGFGDHFIHRLEREHAPIPPLDSGPLPPPFDEVAFIAVLGGGHLREPGQAAVGRLSGASLGRLAEAVRLAYLQPAARLLLCGPQPDGSDVSHAALLAAAAIELGVEPGRITLLPDGRDTYDEVRELRGVVGDAPVLLVTSAWHQPRAIGLARGAGLRALPAPADFTVAPSGGPAHNWGRWSVTGLERTTKATREYLGLAWTRLRGQR